MDVTKDTIQQIFEQGKVSAPVIPTPEGGSVVVVPKDYRIEHLLPVDKMITRIHQCTTFYDRESFVAYVNRFKGEQTRVFALPGFLNDGAGAELRAGIDYHSPGVPNYLAHTSRYLPRYSEQWERWTNAPPMSQIEFAEFIEENRNDIRAPEAASLLDLIRTFKTTRKQDYDSVVYQNNGDVKVAFEDTEQPGGVVVPAELELGIPVYFKGTVYSVPIFMRYRLNNGKVTFSLKVDGADYIEQAAFDEITSAVHTETEIEVYLGRWS